MLGFTEPNAGRPQITTTSKPKAQPSVTVESVETEASQSEKKKESLLDQLEQFSRNHMWKFNLFVAVYAVTDLGIQAWRSIK